MIVQITKDLKDNSSNSTSVQYVETITSLCNEW